MDENSQKSLMGEEAFSGGQFSWGHFSGVFFLGSNFPRTDVEVP